MPKKNPASVLQNISIGGDFLNRASIAQAIKSNINEWDLIDLQISLC